MLGMGIPALTPAVGRTAISVFDKEYQFDLNDHGAFFQANSASWPNRGEPDFQYWLHNDIKDMAYFFTHPLFDTMVNIGGLK